MQTTVKNLTPTKVEITIVADGDTLSRVHTAIVADMAKEVQVTGFRKGHAPAAMAEKVLDQQQLQSRFLDGVLSESYGQAIVENQLRPVGQPEVSITKFVPFTSVEAKLEVEIVGTVKLADYKKFKFSPKAVKVEDKDVEAVIDDLLARDATKNPVDRAAAEGDEVVINFKGVDAKTKEAIAGADGNGYPLVIGSNTFIPGFEPELVGLKPAAEKTFDITFPKDYGAKALQSKKVTFTVTVTEVREVAPPKLDDEFAAKVGPFKTVAELRGDIRKQLQTEKEFQAARELENEILTELAKKSKADIPSALIDDETERMIAEEKQSILYRGVTWQEYLEGLGVSEEDHRKEVTEQAELRVKTGVVLGEVAQAEDIQVEENELQARLAELKKQYTDAKMQEELAKPENQRDIASRILTEKTIAKLVTYATKK
jgi:trigger factor